MDKLSSYDTQSWLSWFMRGLLIVSFLLLSTKMFEISIIKGSYYRGLSEENRIRHVVLPAKRGNILTRSGEIIAGSREVSKTIELTSAGYELKDSDINTPDVDRVSDYKRFYPLEDKAGHLTGYLGRVDADVIGKPDPACPEKGAKRGDELVGKSGLERQYDCLLAGVAGEELLEVNTKGEKIRSLGRRDPIDGVDITTNIDFNLQSEAAIAMGGKKGAVVISDSSGRILALYSSPSYDPNLFMEKMDGEKIQKLFLDEDLPFFNRAIGGTFEPGSVYKPLVVLAALEERAIDSDFQYVDKGFIEVNGFSYRNWYFTQHGGTEGEIGIEKAIARSTDTFFYRIGELTGPEKIANWSSKFGLDKKTGIDLGGEVSGLIPTPEWKEEVKRESWFLGNTYHMAIGQGDVLLTPIEINTYIASIASDGKLCEPRVLGVPECETLKIDQENLDVVKKGMEDVCLPGGTAFTFFDFPSLYSETKVACKTGTAQVGTGDDTHAWFTLFAPYENPEVVATVLVEKGGEGSKDAGPIARTLMDYYFQALRVSKQEVKTVDER